MKMKTEHNLMPLILVVVKFQSSHMPMILHYYQALHLVLKKQSSLSVKSHSEVQNLYLNANKTKIINADKTKTKTIITIYGEELENVNKFEYLGSMLYNNGDGIKEIKED